MPYKRPSGESHLLHTLCTQIQPPLHLCHNSPSCAVITRKTFFSCRFLSFDKSIFSLSPVHFCLPVGPGNEEAASVARRYFGTKALNLWNMRARKTVKNLALNTVTMNIIVALSLANDGSSTVQRWIMADIFPCQTAYTDACKTYYTIPVYRAVFLKMNPPVQNR